MKEELKKLLKTYDKKITVDKICGVDYDTYSPHRTSLHRHKDFQIVWIAKGEGVHQVEQQTYAYAAGSLFLLAPHYLHQIEYNAGVEGYVISFSDSFLNKDQYHSTLLFYKAKDCHLLVSEQERELFNTELKLLHHYYGEAVSTVKTNILQNYLHIILCKIDAFKNKESNALINSNRNELLEQFIILVRDHYQQEKKLSFYQDALAISQRKLSDLVTEGTGISPAKFIEQYALNEAARLLSYTSYSIKEIAAMLGYMDNSYFTKAFKKHFGKSPKQYKTDSSGI